MVFALAAAALFGTSTPVSKLLLAQPPRGCRAGAAKEAPPP